MFCHIVTIICWRTYVFFKNCKVLICFHPISPLKGNIQKETSCFNSSGDSSLSTGNPALFSLWGDEISFLVTSAYTAALENNFLKWVSKTEDKRVWEEDDFLAWSWLFMFKVDGGLYHSWNNFKFHLSSKTLPKAPVQQILNRRKGQHWRLPYSLLCCQLSC